MFRPGSVPCTSRDEFGLRRFNRFATSGSLAGLRPCTPRTSPQPSQNSILSMYKSASSLFVLSLASLLAVRVPVATAQPPAKPAGSREKPLLDRLRSPLENDR